MSGRDQGPLAQISELEKPGLKIDDRVDQVSVRDVETPRTWRIRAHRARPHNERGNTPCEACLPVDVGVADVDELRLIDAELSVGDHGAVEGAPVRLVEGHSASRADVHQMLSEIMVLEHRRDAEAWPRREDADCANSPAKRVQCIMRALDQRREVLLLEVDPVTIELHRLLRGKSEHVSDEVGALETPEEDEATLDCVCVAKAPPSGDDLDRGKPNEEGICKRSVKVRRDCTDQRDLSHDDSPYTGPHNRTQISIADGAFIAMRP